MAGVADRLHRLERLRGLLASGDHIVAKDLATELEVSTRTLMRDLDLLRDEGMLIDSDRGRGGGVRLSRGHTAGSVHLNAAEAIDVLISLAVAEMTHSPMLANLRAIRQKLAAIFARSERDKIRALRRRVFIGQPASTQISETYQPELCRDIHAVRLSFFEQRVLDLTYCDAQGSETQRSIEPHFLYLSPPAWYLLAWDHLRADVRTFRIDRIVRATISEQPFRLRDAKAFLWAAETAVGSP
jgi:predicted DNA-binding transcriptional regulator YafY